MSGSVMALLSAFCFAASNIYTRRAVMRIKDAALGGYITVFVALPLFLMVALVTGDLGSIAGFTWKGYLYLAVAGIIHFVLGRSSNYWSVKYLGANMASVFTPMNIIVVFIIGFTVLGEHITRNMIVGSTLIIIGPALLSWPRKESRAGAAEAAGDQPRLSKKGLVAALLSALFFGMSPLFIKLGMAEGGSALAGTFISYCSASAVLGLTMLRTARKNEVVNMDRRALAWFIFSGILVAMAQLFRYMALNWSPMSVVGPLISTNPVFLLLLSLIFNRNLESFRLNVIFGAALVVAGAVLVYR